MNILPEPKNIYTSVTCATCDKFHGCNRLYSQLFLEYVTLTNMNWIWHCVEFWSLFLTKTRELNLDAKLNIPSTQTEMEDPLLILEPNFLKKRPSLFCFRLRKIWYLPHCSFIPSFQKMSLCEVYQIVGWLVSRPQNWKTLLSVRLKLLPLFKCDP